jgi:hypothetical protein
MMRLISHVAGMGRRGMHIVYWWKSQKEKDHWEDEVVGGWIINITAVLRNIDWGYIGPVP